MVVKIAEKYGIPLLQKIEKGILKKIAALKSSGRLTPYQGNRITCGSFYCFHCKDMWMSRYTRKNTAQKCNGCSRIIYPHNQWPPGHKEGKQEEALQTTIRQNMKVTEVTVELCESCKTCPCRVLKNGNVEGDDDEPYYWD